MTHAFKTISAKPTFGTLKPNLNQSDYINRKKGLITFCKTPSYCGQLKASSSYDIRNSFNIGRYTRGLDNSKILSANKSNLIIGQYSKFNVNNICTVSVIDPDYPPAPCDSQNPCNPCQNPNSVQIDSSLTEPFYQTKQIDPLGELFGRTQCGELNYTQYMTLYPPEQL